MKEKMIILFFMFFQFAFGQSNVSRYTLKSYSDKSGKGEVNISKDSLSLKSIMVSENILEDTKYTVTESIECYNNTSLTTHKIDYEIFAQKGELMRLDSIYVNVKQKDSLQIWTYKSRTKVDTLITKFPTIPFSFLSYYLSTLDYSRKGKIATLNLINSFKLTGYIENVPLVYVEDVIVKREGEIITLKKVKLGDETYISTFWLNKNNEVVIMSIGNSINKTTYRDYDSIDEIKLYKEIFREINMRNL
ncbi:hypothetical protein [Flavobacterium sedimenticola]|uniref:DUF3108 domain-containing protein n=1 Tax=Flavobacterium sedimenticola TaxID=3043286 RepID=A0ABT6XTD4_9FLAO|nr:hypothetical protein [Flavobacterium sedimenticola]MDI9258240.1 hypothetical protein [Flavobacterium sedimenticola]